MGVALASSAACSIISATASTSVSSAALQPDSSQTMCVPSAFNYWLLLRKGLYRLGNPTSRRVVKRVRYTVSLATFQRTLAGLPLLGKRTVRCDGALGAPSPTIDLKSPG